MAKSRLVEWTQSLKRNPLLLILLLATLQLGAVFLFLNRQSLSRQAAPADVSIGGAAASDALRNPRDALDSPAQRSATNSTGPSVPGSPASTSPASPLSASTGKIATKTATKTDLPTTQRSAQTPPELTAEQQALNQQYKANFANSAASVDALIEMRVAIAEGVPSATIGSTKGLAVMDQNRQLLSTLSAGGYTAQPSGSALQLNGAATPSVTLIEPAEGGLLTLGDRTYRGRFLLVNDAGELWVVNLVNLRNYLHSVVASEVSPSWHGEALKAQAVAARSYALTYYFKPMSSLFHLGATEYYQVYSGIAREASETSQAVDQTAGEFVSYRGGIVESLYAASDDIVAEAFRGQGMSQLGALNLAEQGYTYLQILANYYPSTGVSRIVTDYQ